MKCHRDRSTTSRIIHWQMSQGQVIDIMTYNSYSLQYYSFRKGKIGFARTVPVSWTMPIHTRRYSLAVFYNLLFASAPAPVPLYLLFAVLKR